MSRGFRGLHGFRRLNPCNPRDPRLDLVCEFPIHHTSLNSHSGVELNVSRVIGALQQRECLQVC